MFYLKNKALKKTIRAVTIHAGIGLGAIYKHCDRKISLLDASLHSDLIRLFEEAIKSVPVDAHIKDQLIYAAGFNCRYYTPKPRYLGSIHAA